MVQWLRLCAFIAGGAGSIPGRGTRILHAVWRGQKIKKNPKNKQTNKNKEKKIHEEMPPDILRMATPWRGRGEIRTFVRC